MASSSSPSPLALTPTDTTPTATTTTTAEAASSQPPPPPPSTPYRHPQPQNSDITNDTASPTTATTTTKIPITRSIHIRTATNRLNHVDDNLPLSLLRHGSAMIAFGLIWGFFVPLTPYPRLALTAHIQFAVEGTMVVAAGLLLNTNPFLIPPTKTTTSHRDGIIPSHRARQHGLAASGSLEEQEERDEPPHKRSRKRRHSTTSTEHHGGQQVPLVESEYKEKKEPRSPLQRPKTRKLAERLTPLQQKLVYWGLAVIWVPLLSEVANAFLGGTKWVLLPLAYEAAGLGTDASSQGLPTAVAAAAQIWMERVVQVAHMPFALAMAVVWPIITYALFFPAPLAQVGEEEVNINRTVNDNDDGDGKGKIKLVEMDRRKILSL